MESINQLINSNKLFLVAGPCVIEDEKITFENVAPVDQSVEITAADPSKSPLTVLSSDLLFFVRKHCTLLNDLSTSQSTAISSLETSK